MPPQNFSPSPLLANMIQTLWYVERDFAAPADTFKVLPDSRIELIFSFGAACRVEQQILSPCFVVGLLESPLVIRAEGRVRLLGVRFYPWGFQTLLGPLFPHALSGLYAPVPAFAELTHRLESRHDAGIGPVVDALQSFLIEQALRVSLEDTSFINAAQRILRDNGTLDLEELSKAVHVSSRTLRRKFQTVLGKNPKTLARIARFEFVRDALYEDPTMELSMLATLSGYADQAHMQREFRRFSGQTPRQFASESRRQ